jgi:N-acetylglutamate synthase-like GNAT family acetyltransferase
MGVRIRQAGGADVGLLTRLIRESFATVAGEMGLTPENCPKHPSNCTEDWVLEALAKGITYWVLEEDGAPAGCVALEEGGEGVGYLERLCVLPPSRRRGHGRRLVEHLFAEAAGRGMRRVDLGMIAENGALRRWYRERGFAEVEEKVFDHLPFTVLFMSAPVPNTTAVQHDDTTSNKDGND